MFKNPRVLFIIFTIIATLGVSGCAGSQLAVKPDEMASLKGQSTKDIIKKLGEPTRKSSDSYGNQTWEYKSPAAQQGAMNAFAAIGSFGIGTGSNSAYVDILRLTFEKGLVTKYSFEENVMNINIPGMTNTQSSSQGETNPQQIVEPEKSTALKTKEDSGSKNETPKQEITESSPVIASLMITNQRNTKIRKSPSSKAVVIKSLKKGEEVQIVKQRDEWFLVELAGGETGWCHNSVLSQKN